MGYQFSLSGSDVFDSIYPDRKKAEKRYRDLRRRFENLFSRSPLFFVSAPGRAEIVGNHTDHNKGKVLAAAVDLDTVCAVAPRDDTRIVIWSEGYNTPFVVDISDVTVHSDEYETTNAIIRGVAAGLQRQGYRTGGFEGCVTSNVFKGSGLSSSAAFEVMLTACFDALYNDWTIEPMTNARISQYAENQYFGKPSGLLDQSTSAVGSLVSIDFGSEKAAVRRLEADFSRLGFALCVVSVGGEHGNLTGEYASIPEDMRSVASELGRDVLRGVDEIELRHAIPRLKGLVKDRALLRAFHFIHENERVEKAVEQIRREDMESFLQTVIASGESSWKLLQNLYVPSSDNQEMPLALELSRQILQGRGAWRIHGGGFAGTILAFVPFDLLDEYKDYMDSVFGERATTVLNVRGAGAVCFSAEDFK